MSLTRFAKFAWATLAVNLVVVLWGAFVRATGSGAGCGAHWPVCNGQVIPQAPATATIIEFTHRLSSGVALVFVLIMFVWAFRAFPRRSLVRCGAALSMILIITEALVGAGLVLFRWVAGDDSVARVYSMSVHLINTFLLLAAITLTANWASGWAVAGASGGPAVQIRKQGAVAWLALVGLFAMMFLGVSGAIIALGDTLVLTIGLTPEESSLVAQLVSLRIYHPLIAVVVSVYLMLMARILANLRPGDLTQRLSLAVILLCVAQLLGGVINVALQAPVWMQLVHLLTADLLWLAVVLLAASSLAVDAQRAEQIRWKRVFSLG